MLSLCVSNVHLTRPPSGAKSLVKVSSVAHRFELTADTSHAIRFTTRSRQQTEPSSSNVAQWTAVLWNRLERLVEEVANCCIKVYTLEKVLRIKRDAVTNAEFLEEVMQVSFHMLRSSLQKLDEKPSFTFWTTLATAFEGQCKDAARS